MTRYEEFIEAKSLLAPPVGFEPYEDSFPEMAKPFQRDITRWACRRGCAAIFAGTGLGKTLMQLTWAEQVRLKTGGRVLVLSPLAVAHQTVQEARKFGIDDVGYSQDDTMIGTGIVVTNYERRHLFDLSSFSGIVLDESSILKSHDGKTRTDLMEQASCIPYKLCCTATPAPNDWTELGQHAEFLGVMSAKEMLASFFVHDGSIRAQGDADEWRLKSHAVKDFWRWVSSWAVMMKNPNDLGYDEPDYILPPLNIHQVTVSAEYKPTAGMLFPMEARTMSERRAVKTDSVDVRVKAAVDIVNGSPDRPWLVWCDRNAEGEKLSASIMDALEVAGKHTVDVKMDRLLGFCRGAPRVLVTKPKVASFGMNWQHCSDMIFVGLNDSFEQLFQAIRRCWRFGQLNRVNVYMVASELEGAVVKNIRDKEEKFEGMQSGMIDEMRGFSEGIIRKGRVSSSTYEPKTIMTLPEWIYG